MGCLCSKFLKTDSIKERLVPLRTQTPDFMPAPVVQVVPRHDALCMAPLQQQMESRCDTECPPREVAIIDCNQDCDPRCDINIRDQPELVEPTLYDCISIRIHNCPRLTKLPPIHTFQLLETVHITHIKMHVCTIQFPPTLRTLGISYSMMREFRPQHIPTLAQLDLSFNNLKEIPQCIEPMWDANRNMALNLRNNDFWWSMYSDLSPSMISAHTAKELVLAHRLGLLSTQKMVYASAILESKKHSLEAKWLSKQIDTTLRLRKDEAHVTHNNSENIHLTSIQKSTEKSIAHILGYVPKHRMETNIAHIITGIRCDKELADHIRHVCSVNAVHSTYKTTFKDVLIKVYAMIADHPERKTLLDILRQELTDGQKTCLTGQITRLANALNGFVTDVAISISKNEELSNSIVALRKKYAGMYSDAEEYSNEAVPAVWQLLEDMCVPEAEHSVWLEYV